MRQAVFLDRDGVINRKAPEGEYITRWKDFELLPGVAEAIRLLNVAGFAVVVASNQRCVAKELISRQELESIHRSMVDQLAAMNARIDAVYYCPHENEARCNCRKPAPGMLLQAAQQHDLELKGSWMVGDSDSDIEAGKAVGSRTVRILRSGVLPLIASELTAESLFVAVQKILASLM